MEKRCQLFLIGWVLLIRSTLIAQPAISVENTPFSFGFIPQNVKVNVFYPVKNTGDADLSIDDIRTSCGCTKAEGYKDNLNPGEETKVELIFYSGKYKGNVIKRAWIYSNAADNKRALLEFRATVVDQDTMDNESLVLPKPWMVEEFEDKESTKVTLFNNTSEKAKIEIVGYNSDILEVSLQKDELDPEEKTQLLIKLKKKLKTPQAVTFEIKDVAESRITIPIYVIKD